MRALTVTQPWASLIIGGLKDVENRAWSVPSTLPQWGRCSGCHNRVPPTSRITTDHQPIHRPGEQLHRRLPPNPPEACGPIEWNDGPFPFRLAIHAGKRHDGNEFRRALLRATHLTGEGEPDNTMQWIRGWWANRDGIGGYGAVIGTVLVTGCHHADECHETHSELLERPAWCSPWADTRGWHWTLADPVEFAEPIPMRGRQGLWTVPDDLPAEVAA